MRDTARLIVTVAPVDAGADRDTAGGNRET